ncbi:hypothetical protein EJ08DRAFT_325268 [Tothia fuscella]|uniref:Uncharacterized protein n=1 Tax=Tothia fuscella TaxID=1048955 RepID=A0A9P4TWF2_9PEZI|nr:hypothetical protein EJ08DRAFT_325268 [Tothia fuscella]
MALSFIMNAAGAASFIPFLVDAAKKATPPVGAITNVQFITGEGDKLLGGKVPHIALWDDSGHRIGQWHPKKNEKMGAGESKEISVFHTQTEPQNAQRDPYYIMISNPDKDAICISSITVANQKISGGFYGDTGYVCGQSWYHSTARLGPSFATPKCVWLDGDHTSGINAQAMSFHLNDLAPQNDKLNQYQERQDTLCKSTPRFSIWGNLQPDSWIPFFKPPLRYKPDAMGGEGADEDPDAVIDKIVYDKGRYKRSRGRRAGTDNRDPSHLIITDYPSHSAKELCNSSNSYGWDTVSLREGMYCDMSFKEIYPLCSDKNTDNCFDLSKKALVISRLHARDRSIADKVYNTTATWKWTP